MTKREKEIIARAVRLLWGGEEQDAFEQAIRLLLPLAGLHSPAFDAIDKAKTVTLAEVMAAPRRTVTLEQQME